jgi:glycosyltransferase involved in cell wall biosynthesis
MSKKASCQNSKQEIERTQSEQKRAVSAIIPARNEEIYLPKCIAALRRSAERTAIALEIIVVINRCTDRTEEIARKQADKVIREDAKNLSRIRNAGVAQARHEWLLTVDADSQVSENMLSEIVQALEQDDIVGGGVPLIPERYSLGILLTAFCLLPIALRHGISGGLFFCRKLDFNAIGGFDESFHSVEDIDFAKRLKLRGRQSGEKKFVTLWRTRLLTSTRKFDRLGDWYFLLHPKKFLNLLRNRDRDASNEVWYDFKR